MLTNILIRGTKKKRTPIPPTSAAIIKILNVREDTVLGLRQSKGSEMSDKEWTPIDSK